MASKLELCEAANYFKEEVLEIMPDIPGDKLADMIALYLYYQWEQTGITKEEALAIVTEKCGIKK